MSDRPAESPELRRELILYATPTGPLAKGCEQYFDAVCNEHNGAAPLGRTTAQTYPPPHCTLTGFFRRAEDGMARAIMEILPAIDAAGPVPDDAVSVVKLLVSKQWVGFDLQSAWLTELAASVAAAHTLEEGDDALRLKDWLHLSLAYGSMEDGTGSSPDLSRYGDLAQELIDPTAAVGWEVGLWERSTDKRWIRHRGP